MIQSTQQQSPSTLPFLDCLAKTSLVVTIFTTLTACATDDITGGSSLAKSGLLAASQMSQNATISATSLQAARTGLAFSDGFNGTPAASKGLIAQLEASQKALLAYGKLLESLEACYSELSALASDSTATSFNASVQDLANDSNALLKAANSPDTISTQATGAIGSLGTFVITEIQAHDVKSANANISTILSLLIKDLGDPKTEDFVVPVQAAVATAQSDAALALFDSGWFSYSGLVTEIGAPYSLSAVSIADKTSPTYPKVVSGLRNVLADQAARGGENIKISYETSLALLKTLQKQSQTLAMGDKMKPESMKVINNYIVTLQGLVTSLAPRSVSGSSAVAKLR